MFYTIHFMRTKRNHEITLDIFKGKYNNILIKFIGIPAMKQLF